MAGDAKREGPLTQHATRLWEEFEWRVHKRTPPTINLMACVNYAGLSYDVGRIAANELVRMGYVRIEGDLG